MNNIRNFCIIAHIDHGKSTIADRMLEITNTVDKRKMKAQLLDRMDLEQERGITIKLQPVTMNYNGYILNLIDTPGHVDFTYEVSRSLAAVEGAVLLVDATQGIQAQTLANLYLAMEQDLEIIPVVNKIDLPAANKEKTSREIIGLLGCGQEDIIYASGKTGEGVAEVLDMVIKNVPAPRGNTNANTRALIFDSNYDEYRGVVAYIRVIDGCINKKDKIRLLATKAESEALDVGIFKPDYLSTGKLVTGDIGYIVTGFKDVSECRVGDTVTMQKGNEKVLPLKGYNEVKPMVFAGIFQERLRREYGLELIVTLPSVAYKVEQKDGKKFIARTPQQLPPREKQEKIEEPWVRLDIITPKEFVGGVMSLAQEKRGIYKNTEYIDETRAILHYEIPMSAILTDFYDKIKSISSGYASINYEFLGYRGAKVVKMDILVAEEPVEALSTIVYEDDAFRCGKEIVSTLKDSLPKQMFVVKLQAAVGGKIIASERLSAMRKDVTAKLYGGDVTRKRKLLEKQKKGKKKMMVSGRGSVDIPSETFVKILKK